MNTITRKDKYCNSYEEAILSDTFRYIFNKIVRSHGGKNKVLLKNIFDKFLNQEILTDEEKEIFTAFINDREVKIDAENIRKNMNFSRMNSEEKKEIMDDFTAEPLIQALQNKISGEIFTTLDKKAVEVLEAYSDVQVLRIYKNKKPYYAIKKNGEAVSSADFIFSGEEIPYFVKDSHLNNLPVFFAEKGKKQLYGTTDGVSLNYNEIFTYVGGLYSDNGIFFYDGVIQNSQGVETSGGVVKLGDELNEDGSIKYISSNDLSVIIKEKFDL